MRFAVKYLRVVRAVHRLHRVFAAFAAGNFKEVLGKLFPVAGRYIQFLFGDVGDSDLLKPMGFAHLPNKVVQLLSHQRAARGP